MIPEEELYRRMAGLKEFAFTLPKAMREAYQMALADVTDICCDLEEEEFIRRQEEGLRAIYDALEEEGYY